MTTEATPGNVPLSDQLGHADETQAPLAVLETDDIEVLREALAVAWGDLMTAQLQINDQATELDRLRAAGNAVISAISDFDRAYSVADVTAARHRRDAALFKLGRVKRSAVANV